MDKFKERSKNVLGVLAIIGLIDFTVQMITDREVKLIQTVLTTLFG